MNTLFKGNIAPSDTSVLDFNDKINILLQKCNITTNITAVNIISGHKHQPINFRVAESNLSINTKDIKLINIRGEPIVSWMLWESEFQINSYHTKSSDRNFTQNINRIVSYTSGETFHGTISETQYASGNCEFNDEFNLHFFLI